MSNDGPAYRTVESKSNARFKTPVSQGRYELYRKQVYHKEKLITFYRSMAMDILDSPFLLIEQSQIAKTPENRFKGSLVREVFLQRTAKGRLFAWPCISITICWPRDIPSRSSPVATVNGP